MRFPRFHFGAAIALGLSMLCMSAVPVFADGLFPPTLTGSVSGSTVSLSWNTPGGTNSFMIRRGTASAPSSTSDGTLVASLGAVNSYQDRNLVDGTYYYSIFGSDGVLYSSAGAAGPFTVHTPNGTSAAVKKLRMENGLDSRGYPLSSSSSSLISSSASSSAILEMTAPESSSISSSASSFDSSASAKSMSDSQRRICERVAKWFKGNTKMMTQVNMRLQKRFGFECTQ